MILLTGFEPFGGLRRNPFGELASALAGPGVAAAVLPVEYARIAPELERLLAEPFDAVILTGLAVGRSCLSLERVAINFRDRDRPDNAGRTPEETAVVPGAPAAYFSTLPIETLRRSLTAAGLPAEISLSAGAYLCNAAFFLARHLLEGRATPCGFVHLPPTPDLAVGAEPLAFEEQLRGLERIVSAAGSPPGRRPGSGPS